MTLRFAAWQDSFDIWRSAAYFAGMEGAFDPFRYFDELMAADVPEKQARVQAEAMRSAFASYDAGRQKDLITRSDTRDFANKDDVQTLKTDVQGLKEDVRDNRIEIEKVRTGIKATELRLLLWQWGIGLGLAAIMAKGFGWLGF